jgi:spermidine synthase
LIGPFCLQANIDMELKHQSALLKAALFATGLSGIVAEYVLSTLATYFLGDSVFQWTMIVSIMLFAMGLGSHISKYLEPPLLQKFIFIEFSLSILTAFSSILAYTTAAFTSYPGFIIYCLSLLVGLLIGMEIPLVIRINNKYESLKFNISSMLENDYFGSLVGGVFFAFIGLPILGLTYTPFILGFINFTVAVVLLVYLREQLSPFTRGNIYWLSLFVLLIQVGGVINAQKIIKFGEQYRYKDKVIYSGQSKYQQIVLTKSKENYWLFINGNQQFSTVDEVKYHETIVHPLLSMHLNPVSVLILGGGDGCVAREALKYDQVKQIKVVDLDPLMTDLARSHAVLTQINNHSLSHSKVNVQNADAWQFIEHCDDFFDIIIIDLPDPKTVELGRLYSSDFYTMCHKRLRPGGLIITQAGSPFFAAKAFYCIEKTMREAGYATLPLHNHLPTLGEWGWVIGAKNIHKDQLRKAYLDADIEVGVEWINREALMMMQSFGKPFVVEDTGQIEVNSVHDPVLYRYYLNGRWDLY